MENQTKSLTANYRGFPSGSLHSPNYAQEMVNKPTQSEEHSRLVGLIGLVNYSYDNIYCLIQAFVWMAHLNLVQTKNLLHSGVLVQG